MSSDEKPLNGRRVVVTRAAEQAADLKLRLEALGAEVLLLPLVEFGPAGDPAPLDRALAELPTFDWLFLTSQNAVRYLVARARATGVDLRGLLARRRRQPRVAAVGRSTERAARGEGWRVDYVSDGRGGRDLAEGLSGEIRRRRILLPRSDRAGGELPAALAAAGALPEEVVAYRTKATPTLDSAITGRMTRGEVDVVTFASPSAVEALAARLGGETLCDWARATRLAAIGPATAAAIRQAGLEVAIEAPVSTAAGMAAAIAAYFATKPVTRRGSA
ncbi:MAG TPA: uroporphyrinogen-III synthase [Candidatus Acidoferrales bacterium]|nr:uroporphyrinogen-III synthase [Candidatus Acidoferrales bacterium]